MQIVSSRLRRLLVACVIAVPVMTHAQQRQPLRIWYQQPASAAAVDSLKGWKNEPEWVYALPIGNGSLGGMVFGDVNRERIQLNEKSLWSGSPDDNDNPNAYAHLQEIRNLLFAGKYKEAVALTEKTQVCKGVGSGEGNGANVPFGCFQTMGDLRLNFHKDVPWSDYYRGLDIENGLVTVKYRQQGVNYQREIFASYPDKAMVIRLTASAKGALSFSVKADRPERFTTKATNGRLEMSGVMNNGKGGDGMQYKTIITPIVKGGKVSAQGDSLLITKADEVVLVLTAATNYRLHYPDYVNDNYAAQLESQTRKTVAQTYQTLRNRHIADVTGLMSRVAFHLDNTPADNLPTDKRLEQFTANGNDPLLYQLYFQFGRYLLLASSRKGSLPANLQGVWANQLQTAWNGDYHTDINVQMNYWPVEVANLADCQEPLTDLIASLVAPGKRTADIHYKSAGWCVHPITNVWGYTAPGEHPGWGLHLGAGAWLCQHLWEHYAFTGDKKYLEKVMPILLDACRFYLDWLVKDPATGKLVSGPASSPENTFITADGTHAQISMGPSHDQEVIHDLFNNTLKAAQALQNNDPLVARISTARDQLLLPGIGTDGRLMEWAQPFGEAEPTHRHFSHLFALYPGDQITMSGTPALAAAARKSLEKRGDSGTGWSLAWKVACWARLYEGDRALKLLDRLLRLVPVREVDMSGGGGTYPNLFCAHPPFQIDGNLGAVAAISELLLQSQDGKISLLPALPSSWANGEMKGLRARGGFIIDLRWKAGKITNVTVHATQNGACQLRAGNIERSLTTKAGMAYHLDSQLREVKK